MMRVIVRTRLTCFVFLLAGALLVPACNTPAKKPRPAPVRIAPAVPLKPLDPLFEDIEKRTFNFFWETTEGATGLVPDRWPKPPVREHRGRRLRAQCLRRSASSAAT